MCVLLLMLSAKTSQASAATAVDSHPTSSRSSDVSRKVPRMNDRCAAAPVICCKAFCFSLPIASDKLIALPERLPTYV